MIYVTVRMHSEFGSVVIQKIIVCTLIFATIS